jgi:hypothetical protein
MNVYVDPSRFLSVPCDADERIVFDRREGRYHLLPESAARLWERVEGGGTFEVETTGAAGADDPVRFLESAGLLIVLPEGQSGSSLPLSWKNTSTFRGFWARKRLFLDRHA